MILAHNWYPANCCSDKDCIPIPCDQIIETVKGYSYKGLEFATSSVYPSLDQFCHACINNFGMPLCLFIQMNT